MYCYCKEAFFTGLADGIAGIDSLNFEFPDGKKYCQDWLPLYLLSNALVYAVPMIILLVNFFSKTILRLMSRLEKRQTR